MHRVRWPAANILVYRDPSGAVALWFATNANAAVAGERVSRQVIFKFLPDDVTLWTVLTRQLLELERVPVPGDTAPVIMSGALHATDGGVLVAGRRRKGSSLASTVRLVLSPKDPKMALLFELTPAQIAPLIAAMDSMAIGSIYRPMVDSISEGPGTQVWMRKESLRAPHYPRELQARAIEGEVWLTFVVEADGSVDMESLRTWLSDHPSFEMSVRSYLRRARYIPATVRGIAVRRPVRQRFVFALQ